MPKNATKYDSSTSSEEDEPEVMGNQCAKCEITFGEDELDNYQCEDCPRCYHSRCLPFYIVEYMKDGGTLDKDIPIICELCTKK